MNVSGGGQGGLNQLVGRLLKLEASDNYFRQTEIEREKPEKSRGAKKEQQFWSQKANGTRKKEKKNQHFLLHEKETKNWIHSFHSPDLNCQKTSPFSTKTPAQWGGENVDSVARR